MLCHLICRVRFAIGLPRPVLSVSCDRAPASFCFGLNLLTNKIRCYYSEIYCVRSIFSAGSTLLCSEKRQQVKSGQ